MRTNTTRLYSRIQTQFDNLKDNGLTATDAKLQLAENWCKNPQSITRILKTKIQVPSVSNPKQITLFNFEEKTA